MMRRQEPKKITLNAYAKINLALDVLGILDNGYHDLRMIMQQIDLSDQVTVSISTAQGGDPDGEDLIRIDMISGMADAGTLPVGDGNLAYRAAGIMRDIYRSQGGGKAREIPQIDISIVKNIPVAAGLAGGSSNGAAVLLALNRLLGLDLSLAQMMELGGRLGADVPFCMAGQARGNEALGLSQEPLAAYCCEATYDGTRLRAADALRSWIVLCKPPIGVSTAEVYRGIDSISLPGRVDIDGMLALLQEQDTARVAGSMSNVLELYTLAEHPVVKHVKDQMSGCRGVYGSLMSGSGPTVFGLCEDKDEAVAASEELSECIRKRYGVRDAERFTCCVCSSLY